METMHRDVGSIWLFLKEEFPRIVENAFLGIKSGEPTSGDVLVALFVLIGGLIVFQTLFLVVRGRFQARAPETLEKSTRFPRIIGFLVAFIFLGGFVVWAYFVPLAGAALAPGVVSPEGSRKTVQHLEGGIIKTIHVREGQRVEIGQVLLTLENIKALARYDELNERLVYLQATNARLQSEEAGSDGIEFPKHLIEDPNPETQQVLIGQRKLFENRRETLAARELILANRIKQLNEEIAGLNEVILAQDDQLALFMQELEASEDLMEKGLARLPQLLALKRQNAELAAERAYNRSSIARLEQQIGETELQVLAIRQQTLEQISTEKAEIGTELANVQSLLPDRADALARTIVTAPISGRVMNVQVTTERGGVLRSGGDILDIVPAEIDLIIDARVRPQDIENIYPGMNARVILTAYNQRNLPQIFGRLDTISADRLIDERTGEPYFLAKVHVNKEQLANLVEEIELVAGMPADVMLLTGERTLFDFLLKPFADSIRKSFRES